MSPKFAVREGVTAFTSTWVPTILKSMSKPFSFSTIWGCEEVIVKFLALPLPEFVTMIPSAKGSEGSTSSVNGSSPITSRCQK